MQINISSRHGHVSSETQERIREKVERLRRLFDRMTAIDVTVDVQHEDSPKVEVRVQAEHVDDFVASSTSTSVSAALDGVIQKLEKQIRKHKEKVTGHRATSPKHIEADVVDSDED